MPRPGNNPKRRVARVDRLSREELAALAEKVRYVASGHHKRFPANYGLERTSPRPNKSLCDIAQTVFPDHAKSLIKKGILCGMISEFFHHSFPKYVWCVDEDGEVYEAKTDATALGAYHGYRLEEDDEMRHYVIKVWKERCPQTGK